LTRITGTLYENKCTFLIIYCSVLLRMRNVSDTGVDKTKTHFIFSRLFFFENRSFYEIMWKNVADSGEATDDNVAYANCMLDT
jgi:hypothetical protein